MGTVARMLEEIQQQAAETAFMTGCHAISAPVLEALGRVSRRRFVPPGLVHEAYENEALPIGYGQTISQPFIVALMTELLKPAAHHTCLEVGTGSGYQAAVLSQLVGHVYTVEIVAPLYRIATERLHRLGFHNVHTVLGDGNAGHTLHAPYDRIIVTAAAPAIPHELVAQLRPGGRMLMPLATGNGQQTLVVLEKDPQGEVITTQVLPVIFVPLIGGDVSADG